MDDITILGWPTYSPSYIWQMGTAVSQKVIHTWCTSDQHKAAIKKEGLAQLDFSKANLSR